MKQRELRNLTIGALAALYDAMIGTRNLMFAAASQPRAGEAAMKILEEQAEDAAEAAEMIAEELSRREPSGDSQEVLDFTRVVLDWHVFQCGDRNDASLRTALDVLAARKAA